jgi:hypothetical protein
VAECRHGIDQASCADCRPSRGIVTPHGIMELLPPDWGALWRAAHPDDGLGPWIESRWGGHCRGCGELFEPGDLIRKDFAEDGYLAECCGVSPDG